MKQFPKRPTITTPMTWIEELEATALQGMQDEEDEVGVAPHTLARVLALAKLAEEAREVIVTASAAHTYGSYRGVPDLRRDAEKWLTRYAAATRPDVPRRPDSNAK